MTDLQFCIKRWATFAQDLDNLETYHIWAAFQAREAIRQAIAAGATLTEHESAALALGDDLFAEQADALCNLMEKADWLPYLAPEHYISDFYRRHRGQQTDADN